MAVSQLCGHCGSGFNVSPHLAGCARFCSQKCAHAALHPPVVVDCDECGVAFRVPPNRKETAKFCSRECTNKSEQFKALQATQQAGEKSWRWNGGVTGEGYVRGSGGKHRRHEHRIVVADEMATHDPTHPFLLFDLDVPILRSDIEVHHIDRNRANNAPRNLLAVTKAAHAAIHHRGIQPPRHESWPSNPSHW